MAWKRGCSLVEHFYFLLFALNSSLTCFWQLLLFAGGPWADRVMQMSERAFCGQRSQRQTPIPTPGAPALTHPQRSVHPALPAVLGSWRDIFTRTSCSVSETERIESMRLEMQKKIVMRDASWFVVSLIFNYRSLIFLLFFLLPILKTTCLVCVCWQYL